MNEPCPHELEVSAYLLGAQAEAEARAFEAHLRECERCRRDVERLRLASDALGASAPPLSAPPAVKERVMAVVRSEAHGEPARRWSRRPRWSLALVAGALLVGGVAGYALRSPGEESRVVRAAVNRTGASAQLVIRGDQATLRMRGLGNPRDGRVYQVWVMRPGDRAPRPTNALFVTRSDRTAAVAVPGDADGLDQVLVTAEPAGGSRAPTSRPIIAARGI